MSTLKPAVFLIFLIAIISFFISPHPIFAEDVNLSTYYPSPYGSYKRLSIEDVGADANVYGSLQIIREAAGHLGSHIAFIREGVSRMGLGYEQSSDTFGFGPAANAATTAFQPTLLAIDATGEVGIGTNNPSARLHATTENATTSTVTDILRINHSSTNIPTTNFGTGLLFTGQSSLVDNRNMARIQSVWTNAVDGSRSSSLQFQTEDNAAAALTTHMTLSSAGLDVSADGGSILVPRKASTGDPAGSNGMIYYNSADAKFRIYQNGTWTDMAAAGGSKACVSRDTGAVGGVGYTGTMTVDLMVGGRNICEDDEGCAIFLLHYDATYPAGRNIYYSTTLPFFQRLVGVNQHPWYNGSQDRYGTNGDGVNYAISPDWGASNFILYDDSAAENNPNQLSAIDYSTTRAYRVSVCDT